MSSLFIFGAVAVGRKSAVSSDALIQAAEADEWVDEIQFFIQS